MTMATEQLVRFDDDPESAEIVVDAGMLAWEADRLTLADLEPEHRRWFEQAATALETAIQQDVVLQRDGVSEEMTERLQELEAEQRQLRAIATTVRNIFGIDPDADDEDVDEQLDGLIRARLENERAEGVKDATVPSRQDARTKGLRLLVEGRLEITRRDVEGDHAGLVVATCKGDSGTVYTLGYDPRPEIAAHRRWRCTCPELRGNCSHLHALRSVITIHERSTA